MNRNLPTTDLKEYGIINEDNSFSKKLSQNDIDNFLKGYAIVADNGKDRIVFHLSENNTRLNVNFYQRDKSINDIIEQSEKEIVYSQIAKMNDTNDTNDLNTYSKAFVLDKTTNKIIEYDLLTETEKIAKIIAEKKDVFESNRFKVELLKLKSFLQDKIDKFPEIAKKITNDLNIVSKTINTIDDTSPNESQSKKQEKTDIRLNVNDPDLYQEANREREENEEIQQERKRGFRR